MFDQGDGSRGRGGGGMGMGFPFMLSPWMLVARMLGGGPSEKVDHNLLTQILIPCLRALMGGAGICIVVTGYISASYVWHANVALDELGRAALPLLVFGLSGVISALIGWFNDPPEDYWGSRQSMFLIFGIASLALCYVFTGIARKDPEGILFWEIVKSSCFVGLATAGFLLALWGIVEQLIVYQMTESQRVGWGVIKRRLDDKIEVGTTEAEGEPVPYIKEWIIHVTMTPKGQKTGPVRLLRFNQEIVTDGEVSVWAASVLAGADTGYAEWVGKGKLSRRAYDHIWEVLAKKGYAAKRGKASNAKWFLTGKGKQVLRVWLQAFDLADRMQATFNPDDEEETLSGDLELDDDDHIFEGGWEIDERPANSS